MKRVKNILGSVLIYTLFLVNIALVMAVVVLNIGSEVFNSIESQNIIRNLSWNIIYKWNFAFKYIKFLNKDGTGEIDNISCPTAVTMSGTINKQIISSSLHYWWWNSYCSGTYMGSDVSIYFNENFSWFTGATYLSQNILLISWEGNFSDTDMTRISFTQWWAGIDKLDDDFNNDDYKVTWGSWVYYPDNYEDNDVLGRKLIYSYISSWSWYTNIFWNNTKMMKIIKDNPNNNDFLNLKIGEVGTGVLYLDINKPFSFKLVKFDRVTFEDSWELNSLQMIEKVNQTARTGYIQNDGIISTGGIVKTGNEYVFDFKNNDYALFLWNYSTWTLFFTLKGYTNFWTGIYITPIDDSNSQLIRFFWGDIVIDSEKRYLYNQFETVSAK